VSEIGCGVHTAFIYKRGGRELVMELTPLAKVVWTRIRDDISVANVFVGITPECCEQLGNIKTVAHELHIFRNGVKVWEGPIIRLEYMLDRVEVWAQDILWVAKHTALSKGYNQKAPNTAFCGWRMNWLLRDMTFAKYGDPWNALAGIQWVKGGSEPKTSRVVNAWSCTTWDDFDAYAEDVGMDYAVINRQVLFWNTNLKWRVLPPLYDYYLQVPPVAVEYGNEFQTRAVVTDGNGYAGMYTVPDKNVIAEYQMIDLVRSSYQEGQSTSSKPSASDIKAWTEQAKALVEANPVPPVRVRVSENTGLLPSAPYDINDLIPGVWVQVHVTRLCRQVSEWHKLDSVAVTDEGGKETVQISTVSAPKKVVEL
jgi:hypothetical protein